jgi:hypothetical protein
MGGALRELTSEERGILDLVLEQDFEHAEAIRRMLRETRVEADAPTGSILLTVDSMEAPPEILEYGSAGRSWLREGPPLVEVWARVEGVPTSIDFRCWRRGADLVVFWYGLDDDRDHPRLPRRGELTAFLPDPRTQELLPAIVETVLVESPRPLTSEEEGVLAVILAEGFEGRHEAGELLEKTQVEAFRAWLDPDVGGISHAGVPLLTLYLTSREPRWIRVPVSAVGRHFEAKLHVSSRGAALSCRWYAHGADLTSIPSLPPKEELEAGQ